MPRKTAYRMTTTTSTGILNDCAHTEGWYRRVWWPNYKYGIFSRYIFICTDCGEILPGNRRPRRKS